MNRPHTALSKQVLDAHDILQAETENVRNQGTESAQRVADVLIAAFNGGSLGVSEISRELGLSKTVVHRILKSLTSRGLLVFDPVTRKYDPGPTSLIVGARALNFHGLSAAAHRAMHALQEITGETVTVSALVDSSRFYVGHAPGPREPHVVVETSRGFPLYAGSSSKVILAFADPHLRARVLRGRRPRLTPGTVTDPQRLSQELKEIATIGVATSREERQRGVASVAGAVFGHDGRVVGSISVCGPVHRFDEPTVQRYRRAVGRYAHLVTRSLRTGANGAGVYATRMSSDR